MAHLEALRSWGISRFQVKVLPEPQVAGEPEPIPVAEAGPPQSAPAPEPVPVDDGDLFGDSFTAQPSLSREQAGAVLANAAQEVAACTACRLHSSRSQTVFGVGDSRARLMFIGEAPGAEEDRQGKPFVGRAGKLLDRIILALGLKREDVYISNILKCRPPGNRDPRPDEVASCTPFLLRQIETIQPQMIVALGRPAANFLLDTTAPLARLRGRRQSFRGIPVVVTYHPAYLLRNPSAKKLTWQDLQGVLEDLELPGPTTSSRTKVT